MSWRDERVTISRERLVGIVIAGGFAAATLSLVLSAVLVSVLTEPPAILLVAVLAVFSLRIMISLFETASFYLRRRARRRRMRR
jgi:H+/Cl- antiporter ClcA